MRIAGLLWQSGSIFDIKNEIQISAHVVLSIFDSQTERAPVRIMLGTGPYFESEPYFTDVASGS